MAGAFIHGRLNACLLIKSLRFRPELLRAARVILTFFQQGCRAECVGEIERRRRGGGTVNGKSLVVTSLSLRQPISVPVQIPEVPHRVSKKQVIPLKATESHSFLVEGQSASFLSDVAQRVGKSLQRANQMQRLTGPASGLDHFEKSSFGIAMASIATCLQGGFDELLFVI